VAGCVLYICILVLLSPARSVIPARESSRRVLFGGRDQATRETARAPGAELK
jgi:hypothetical protein